MRLLTVEFQAERPVFRPHSNQGGATEVNILSPKMPAAENRTQRQENAESGHALYEDCVKKPIVDQSVGGDPHSPPETAAVGHRQKISRPLIKAPPVTFNGDSPRSIFEQHGDSRPEKSQGSAAAQAVYPGHNFSTYSQA